MQPLRKWRVRHAENPRMNPGFPQRAKRRLKLRLDDFLEATIWLISFLGYNPFFATHMGENHHDTTRLTYLPSEMEKVTKEEDAPSTSPAPTLRRMDT